MIRNDAFRMLEDLGVDRDTLYHLTDDDFYYDGNIEWRNRKTYNQNSMYNFHKDYAFYDYRKAS